MRISDWSSDVCSSDLVYGFAKQSGGHFKIYSEVGHGTTARLYLPRALGDATVEPERRTKEAVEESHAVILVVEDSAEVRQGVTNEIGRGACRGRVCQYG